MSVDQFLEELAVLKYKFFLKDGCVRFDSKVEKYCPLTAVCFSLGKHDEDLRETFAEFKLMTLDEFFVELAKAKPKFKIYVTYDLIRLVPLDQPGIKLCPLTALAYINGKEYLANNYDKAGIALGLSLDLSHKIAKAADRAYLFNEYLRDKLLEILL